MLIDDRAGSRDLADLPPLDELAELVRLPAGDVAIYGNGQAGRVAVGVEVKRIDDLISSIQSGRLQGRQMPDMRAEYDVSWLLVHGLWRPNPKTGALQTLAKTGMYADWSFGRQSPLPYAYLTGWLVTAQMAGVHVARVWDLHEAAWWLAVLERWWSKPWDRHRGLRALDRSRDVVQSPGMSDEFTRVMRIASAFPMISYERARNLAQAFATPAELVCADVEALSSVAKVGPVIAKSFVEAARGEG